MTLLGWPFLAAYLGIQVLTTLRMAKKYEKVPQIYDENARYRKVFALARTVSLLKLVNLEVSGQDDLPSSPVLYTPNHKSNFDPFAVFMAVYKRKEIPLVTFVAKIELKEKRIVRAVVTLIDGFYIDRGNLRQSVEVSEMVKKTLLGYRVEDRVFTPKSVCVFPEGHRHPIGEFGEFKPGAFKPAVQAYKPIVPVAVINTRGLMERTERPRAKGFFKTVKVVFLKRMPVDSFFSKPTEITAANVKQAVVAAFSRG